MGLFGRAQRPAHGETLENSVGPSSSFKGTLRSDGGARIDGSFEGLVEVAGNVVLGRDGRVVGDIAARNVTVAGMVRGNIDATGQLQILSTGQVFGDISVASVMIDEGGIFQGSSRLRGFEQPALAPPRDDADAAGHAPAARPGVVGRTVDSTARLAPDRPAPGGPDTTAGGDEESRSTRRRTRRAAEDKLPAVTDAAAQAPGSGGPGKPSAEGRDKPSAAAPGADEPPPEGGPRGKPTAAAQASEYDLDLDFGGLDIEPIIPDVFIEEQGDAADGEASGPAQPPPAPRARSTRKGNRRGG